MRGCLGMAACYVCSVAVLTWVRSGCGWRVGHLSMVLVYVAAVSILAERGTSAVVGVRLVRWVCVCVACPLW